MKAISLWQPWASAVAVGSKRIETRSWRTDYRGPLAIHATKHCEDHLLVQSPWNRGVLDKVGSGNLRDVLPFGAIVAICRLVDCKPTEEMMEEAHQIQGKEPRCWSELELGDFSPGRFAWLLEDVKQIDPIPYKGAQGFFNVTLSAAEWFKAGKSIRR